jgi:hypothetical protein
VALLAINVQEKLPEQGDILKSGHLSRQIVSSVGTTYLTRFVIVSSETMFFSQAGSDVVIDQIPLIEGQFLENRVAQCCIAYPGRGCVSHYARVAR